MRTTKYNHIYIVEFISKWANLLHTLGKFDASIYCFYMHLLIPPIAQGIDSHVARICWTLSSTEKPGMPKIDFAVATKSVADDYPGGMFPFHDSYISKLSSIDVLRW